jgi:hypothetical protein
VSHFYFDIRDGEALLIDEEGLNLSSQRAAEIEAALSVADMAEQLETLASADGLAVEVRDADGPVLKATFVYAKIHPIN